MPLVSLQLLAEDSIDSGDGKNTAMQKPDDVVCRGPGSFIAIFGILGLFSILVALPSYYGGNIFSAQYWLSLLDYLGLISFIGYLGLWGILFYYIWVVFNSNSKVVISHSGIKVYKLLFSSYKIEWSMVAELTLVEVNAVATDLIVVSTEHAKLKFRYLPDLDADTQRDKKAERINHLRQLALRLRSDSSL